MTEIAQAVTDDVLAPPAEAPVPSGADPAQANDANVRDLMTPPVGVFNGANTQMEERTLLGASVTYRDAASRWSATLYGTNLTDETFRVAALPVAGLWNFTNYGAPRQIGVSLNLKFD